MRRVVLALFALVALSGCVSMLDSAYDDRARSECERETRGSARGDCLDRVDDHRRNRD